MTDIGESNLGPNAYNLAGFTRRDANGHHFLTFSDFDGQFDVTINGSPAKQVVVNNINSTSGSSFVGFSAIVLI